MATFTKESRDEVIQACVEEYKLVAAIEDDEDRLTRRAAIRGVVVRLGLYTHFLNALGDDE